MRKLYSFLANAKAQRQILKTLDGLVMYHLTESVIPEYIYFMPKKLVDDKSLSKFFGCQFIYMPDKFYVIYFNPVRWVMPNLADTMRALKGIAMQYGKDKLLFQISYGRITFDVTHANKVKDDYLSNVIQVPIYINDKRFFINVADLPEEMGAPKWFEELDFCW